MNVLNMISGVSRKIQWEERAKNERISDGLNVDSIGEAARKSILKWFGHVQRMNDSCLPKLIWNAKVNEPIGRGRPRRQILASIKRDLNEGFELILFIQNLALNRLEHFFLN